MLNQKTTITVDLGIRQLQIIATTNRKNFTIILTKRVFLKGFDIDYLLSKRNILKLLNEITKQFYSKIELDV